MALGLQTFLAALLVIASAAYTLWRLMPTQRQLKLLEWLAKQNQWPGAAYARKRLARKQKVAVDQTKSACDGCAGETRSPSELTRPRPRA